ncbi:hypothetical protein JW930_07785 [Candidatus Woesearchaeota archaeon]|nr:hypothetical protein [Candidatus Woesearchaeota archaeon]
MLLQKKKPISCVVKCAVFFLVAVFAIIASGRASIAQLECDNRPEISIEPRLVLFQDQPFYYKLEVSNANQTLLYSYAEINSTLKNFQMDIVAGEINFTPKKEDRGRHKLVFIVSNMYDCFDTKLVELYVHASPVIANHSPESLSPTINEGSTLHMSVDIISELDSTDLIYSWYMDNDFYSNKKSTMFRPDYDDAGMHNVSFVVTDAFGLNDTIRWRINVKNTNRYPVQKYQLPGLVLYPKDTVSVYNLNQYFEDPDGDNLTFDYYFSDEHGEDKSSESKLFDVIVDEEGEVTYISKTNITLTEYLIITAQDSYGANTLSNPFSLRIITKEDKFEFFRSPTEQCEPEIVCGNWSNCLVTGIKIRECFDANDCSAENKTLIESEPCDFNASCYDGIRNQNETGVDCGGPCEPCPSCEDNLQNQGEEGIDCGGPCEPCPTCNDNIQNQNETDIDCGGNGCPACEAGFHCKLHTDCLSYNCINSTCMEATCDDYRKNQGEENIDCGGPCEPCPTCTDEIQNQDEEGIDCGGPCKACPACNDRIKNQGEIFKDCGGPCPGCLLLTLFRYRAIFIVISTLIIGGALLYFMFSKTRGRDPYAFLIKLNTKLRFLRKNDETRINLVNSTINNLRNIQQKLSQEGDEANLQGEFVQTCRSLFKDLFGLDDVFTKGVLKHNLAKQVKNPFVRKILMRLYNDYCAETTASPLFKLEINQKIEQIIYVIEEIKYYL